MDKTQFVDALTARFDGDRDAAAHALDAVLDTLTQQIVGGEKVALTGFGSFRKKVRSARTVRHPQSGKAVKLPPRSRVQFSPDGPLKKAVRRAESDAD